MKGEVSIGFIRVCNVLNITPVGRDLFVMMFKGHIAKPVDVTDEMYFFFIGHWREAALFAFTASHWTSA